MRRYLLSKIEMERSRTSNWEPSRRNFAHTLEILARQMEQTQPSISDREERRYPYLDQNLLEFLAAVPSDQVLRARERRSLMRRALVNLLPKEILTRQTKSVTARSYIVGLNLQWLEIEAVFKASLVSRRHYIAQTEFLSALRATRKGTISHLIPLLRIASLESWLRDMDRRGLITDQPSSRRERPIDDRDSSVHSRRESERESRAAVTGARPKLSTPSRLLTSNNKVSV